ncbi:MAG: hypothetical protein WD397_05435 [Wenzhouxiangellaceae bacterium]
MAHRISSRTAALRNALTARYRRLAHFLSRGRERLRRRFEPAPATARWMARAGRAGVLALGAWIGAETFNFPQGIVVNALAGLAMVWLLLGLSRLTMALARWLPGFADRYLTRAGAAAMLGLIGLLAIFDLPPALGLPVGVSVGLLLVLAGVGIGLLGRRRLTALTLLVPSAGILALGVAWLVFESPPDDPVRMLVEARDHSGDQASSQGGNEFAEFVQPGPYRVETLTYGSGSERRRTEYAEQVAWESQSVDARDMLGRPSGLGINLRQRWLGYGLDELPLNGRVWYPAEVEQPLPLVLIVHGNHDMMEYSDPGYAWIGEHLASRGHVAVSVDQNFLNGSAFGGLDRENATRAWILLEHLAAWRQWQRNPEHPLHRLVDLGKVILIGHSRGGEAAALAAAFNRLDHHPEDAAIEFDYGFGIQGVGAIAPVDGQFQPSGKPTELADISYFLIHGGMDGDVSYMVGDRQWMRTSPDIAQGRFSASLYVHHANHGQFNTAWGDNDSGMFLGRLLNRAGLMGGEEQRQVARLYLTAFVENALARPDRVPALFCDPDAVGELLPPTLYVARCNDGRRKVIADFEEDIDLTTGSLPGVSLTGQGLDLWQEKDVGFRASTSRGQTGVFLGWHAHDQQADGTGDGRDNPPAWEIGLGDPTRSSLALGADAVLWLDLAHVDRDPPERDKNTDEEGTSNDKTGNHGDSDDGSGNGDLRPAVQMQIRLTDDNGRSAERPLAAFARLLPPLPAQHTRLEFLDSKFYKSPTEPVLQSVAIPLEGFAARGVDIASLRSIRFRFNDDNAGMVVVERVALAPGRGSTYDVGDQPTQPDNSAGSNEQPNGVTEDP